MTDISHLVKKTTVRKRDLARPDKLLLQGLKSVTGLSTSLYSRSKSEAKAKAELTFFGEQKLEEVQSQLYLYSEQEVKKEEQLTDYEQLLEVPKGQRFWLNFHGIHDVNVIRTIGEVLQLDRLTLRRILDTTQRPKAELYDHYIGFNVKSILKVEMGEIHIEQLSFVLTQHGVVSFQEEVGDHFEDIRQKIAEKIGFIRGRSADYLLSQLLDAILDNYFETIEQLNREVAVMEKVLQKDLDKSQLITLERLKNQGQIIKRSLSPLREALQNILNMKSKFIQKGNEKFFRDLALTSSTAIEEVDTTLRNLEGLTNIYFATQSQKMNEIMQVLTTVATVFIPLTFIAGIYGMNFENMPELHHPYGYFIVWGVMIVLAIGMWVYFKWKKWV